MKTIIFLMSLFAMIGCTTTLPPPQVITKVETKLIKVPENLLLPCLVTRPPDPLTYIEMDYEGKENELTNYSIMLIKDLRVCNSQLKEIKRFQEVQIDSFKTVFRESDVANKEIDK